MNSTSLTLGRLDWPQPQRDPRNRGTVLFILGAHLALGWALLQSHTVAQAVRQVAPVVVQLMPDSAVSPQLPALARPLATPPQQRQEPLPQPSPLNPLPLPTVADAPPAPAPVATPAPQPVERTPERAPEPAAAPAVAELPRPPAPAASVPKPQPVAAPAAPRQMPSSALAYTEPPAVVYPRLSRRNGEAGRVLVRALIEPEGGAPAQVQLAQSSGYPRLDDAALAAVRQARFRPWLDKGVAQPGWALIPIDFELER